MSDLTKIGLAPRLFFPPSFVTKKAAFIGISGSGKTTAAKRTCEEMLRLRAQVAVIDPVGQWAGLRVMQDGTPSPFKVPVFGGLHGDLPLEPTAGAMIADVIVDTGTSAVIDVSMLSVTDAPRFVADFAERLFERKKASPSALHLFVDEAQDFVAETPANKEETRSRNAMVRLLKVGRNFGIGCSLITQQPASVSKKGLNQAEVLIVLQLNGAHERKAIREWISDKGGKGTGLDDELRKLKVGEAFVWSPSWLELFDRFQLYPCDTADLSKLPAAKQTRAELAPLDLEKIRTSMGVVARHAAENDPSKLKARIAELEERIAGARAVDAADLQAALDRADRAEGALAEVQGFLDETHDVLVARVGAVLDQIDAIAVVRGAPRTNGPSANAANAIPAPHSNIRAKLPEGSSHDSPHAGHSVRTKSPAARSKRNADRSSSPSDAGIVAGARRMLQVLASWSPGDLTRQQLATLAGMSKSGTFDTYVSRLGKSGYLESSGGGGLRATKTGIAFLRGDFPPAPTTTAELVAIWSSKLGGAGATRMLQELVALYPKETMREELAKRTGMTKSGTFDTYLSRLRKNGLLGDAIRGSVKASPTLFMSRRK